MLAPTAMVALGSAREWGPFYHGGSYSQSSQSDLQATFAVASPYECPLTGRLESWGDSGGTCVGCYEGW
ncbi:MAG: hypothetical protein MUC88_12335 [Planctomycetes bacterium]|nr:hypothetical protein [Planctomycetota bacterium]